MQHDLDVQAFVAPHRGGSSPAEIADAQVLTDVLSIHEYERQRFAQELHDSAGQLVIALQLSIAHLKRVEKDSGHDDLLEEITDTVRRIDKEIRSIAFLSYPVELCDRSLCLALQSLALGFGRRTGVHTAFKWIGDQSAVGDAVSTAILRVTQEALVNIHRHSHASSARILVERRPGQLHVAITDNGVGFPSVQRAGDVRGIGLQGMRHRVEELGGRISFGNMRHGARISVFAPVAMAG